MKKLIKNTLVALILLLSTISCISQIKNSKTETVTIYGNCGMCQKTIEKAGNIKNVVKISWDIDTHVATLTYDSYLSNPDAILKRIALAGYDSDKFLAPDTVYNNLPGCCQYERVAKVAAKANLRGSDLPKQSLNISSDIPSEDKKIAMNETRDSNQSKQTNPLKEVFENYFAVKDALVKTDVELASIKATALLTAINAFKLDKLEINVHLVWMKVFADLKEDAEHISGNKEASHQRDHFMTLSINIYKLMKVAKSETPTYYQFCPMANNGKGANWLSKESEINNPYYGAMMLSCGKTVETIK